MKRRKAKNYPRRKTWVVLASNPSGELAVLAPNGRYILVKKGISLPAKPYRVTDSDLDYDCTKLFRPSEYKFVESKVIDRATKQASLTPLKKDWEGFIARLGSAKCPVDFTEIGGEISITLKKETKQ